MDCSRGFCRTGRPNAGRPGDFYPAPIASLLGVLGPCLLYGMAIHYIQTRVANHSQVLGLAPMPFALAAVATPLFGCIGALPWAIPRAMEAGVFDAPTFLSSLLIFALGDALGILLLAPPIVWIADRLKGGQFPKILFDRQIAIEIGIAQLVAWVLVWACGRPAMATSCRRSFSQELGPVFAWGGWAVGWRTVVSALILLPLTDHAMSDADRIRIHMLIATLARLRFSRERLRTRSAKFGLQSVGEIACCIRRTD